MLYHLLRLNLGMLGSVVLSNFECQPKINAPHYMTKNTWSVVSIISTKRTNVIISAKSQPELNLRGVKAVSLTFWGNFMSFILSNEDLSDFYNILFLFVFSWEKKSGTVSNEMIITVFVQAWSPSGG